MPSTSTERQKPTDPAAPVFYLDNAATTRIYPEVLQSCLPYLEQDFGNPSSLHPLGMRARRGIKRARESLAKLLSVPPQAITFTSGGTESCNLALQGAFASSRLKGERLLISAIEHPAVLETAQRLAGQGARVERIPVTRAGIIDLTRLEAMLDESVRMVSVMAVNNELGTIQPVDAIGRMVADSAPNATVHVDAVQAFTKFPAFKRDRGIGLVSLSGHKVHGPKGAGVLVRLSPVPLEPMAAGGGQEDGLRSGTENPFAIIALAQAALRSTELHRSQRTMRKTYFQRWMDVLEEFPHLRVFRSEAASPYIVNFSYPNVPGEVTLHHLEQEGLYVSTGSACATIKPDPSHVLLAAGMSEQEALSSVRLSFSVYNTLEELEQVIPRFRQAMTRVSRL